MNVQYLPAVRKDRQWTALVYATLSRIMNESSADEQMSGVTLTFVTCSRGEVHSDCGSLCLPRLKVLVRAGAPHYLVIQAVATSVASPEFTLSDEY